MSKPPDDNELARAGRLPANAFVDADRIDPPPPDFRQPRVAPAPDLAADMPTFEAAYAPEAFAADQNTELVPLARLPSWPRPDQGTGYGHGIGDHLAGMLGVGLRPGEMLALGAASAGAGKTAFLMQLAEGLGMRNGPLLAGERRWGPQLTPVVIASEMSAQALTWRTLARWTDYSARYFRGGATMARQDPDRAEAAWAAGRAALEGGELAEARRWMRLLDPTRVAAALGAGTNKFVPYLTERIELWCSEIRTAYPGREVVPVVVVDPVQRYQGGDEDAVAALNALARGLREATVERGWLCLLSSDTNKVSAAGRDRSSNPEEEGAGAFRGSYNLIHEVTAALFLQRATQATNELPEEERRSGQRIVETVVVKSRWGGGTSPWPRFRWFGPTGRFWPMAEDATVRASKEESARSAKQKRSGDDRTQAFETPKAAKIYTDEP